MNFPWSPCSYGELYLATQRYLEQIEAFPISHDEIDGEKLTFLKKLCLAYDLGHVSRETSPEQIVDRLHARIREEDAPDRPIRKVQIVDGSEALIFSVREKGHRATEITKIVPASDSYCSGFSITSLASSATLKPGHPILEINFGRNGRAAYLQRMENCRNLPGFAPTRITEFPGVIRVDQPWLYTKPIIPRYVQCWLEESDGIRIRSKMCFSNPGTRPMHALSRQAMTRNSETGRLNLIVDFKAGNFGADLDVGALYLFDAIVHPVTPEDLRTVAALRVESRRLQESLQRRDHPWELEPDCEKILRDTAGIDGRYIFWLAGEKPRHAALTFKPDHENAPVQMRLLDEIISLCTSDPNEALWMSKSGARRQERGITTFIRPDRLVYLEPAIAPEPWKAYYDGRFYLQGPNATAPKIYIPREANGRFQVLVRS